ncbi:MAG TPA: ribbon-helix-helix protein, CopG family [Longimicrobium sp.]|nr:ribbon-helix-helix protein, CopG family [Longimicrobium sp.]
MSTIQLTLPDSVYARVQEAARRHGISAEEFIEAAAEKLASDEYLNARARRSTSESFEWALAKVPDVPPGPGDGL